MFIDNQPDEVQRQWDQSGQSKYFDMRVISRIDRVETVLQEIPVLLPEATIVGFGLGNMAINGSTLIQAIVHNEMASVFCGYLFTNSAGENEQFLSVEGCVDMHLNKDPRKLAEAFRRSFVGLKPMPNQKRYSPYNARIVKGDLARDYGAIWETETDDSTVLRQLLANAQSNLKAEAVIHAAAILGHDDVLDEALDVFIGTYHGKESLPKHDSWVHSLSHFSDFLWERGKKEWVKRLYPIAFNGLLVEGYLEGRWFDLLTRLTSSFSRNADWYDVGTDYGLTEAMHLLIQQAGQMRTPWEQASCTHFLHPPFASEVEYLMHMFRTRKSLAGDLARPDAYFFDEIERRLEELGAHDSLVEELKSVRLVRFCEAVKSLEEELRNGKGVRYTPHLKRYFERRIRLLAD
ncbi:MAG: hypothetical protein Q7R48_03930 [bacterium]|nr:hypothetical protein [bacterium]